MHSEKYTDDLRKARRAIVAANVDSTSRRGFKFHPTGCLEWTRASAMIIGEDNFMPRLEIMVNVSWLTGLD